MAEPILPPENNFKDSFMAEVSQLSFKRTSGDIEQLRQERLEFQPSNRQEMGPNSHIKKGDTVEDGRLVNTRSNQKATQHLNYTREQLEEVAVILDYKVRHSLLPDVFDSRGKTKGPDREYAREIVNKAKMRRNDQIRARRQESGKGEKAIPAKSKRAKADSPQNQQTAAPKNTASSRREGQRSGSIKRARCEDSNPTKILCTTTSSNNLPPSQNNVQPETEIPSTSRDTSTTAASFEHHSSQLETPTSPRPALIEDGQIQSTGLIPCQPPYVLDHVESSKSSQTHMPFGMHADTQLNLTKLPQSTPDFQIGCAQANINPSRLSPIPQPPSSPSETIECSNTSCPILKFNSQTLANTCRTSISAALLDLRRDKFWYCPNCVSNTPTNHVSHVPPNHPSYLDTYITKPPANGTALLEDDDLLLPLHRFADLSKRYAHLAFTKKTPPNGQTSLPDIPCVRDEESSPPEKHTPLLTRLRQLLDVAPGIPIRDQFETLEVSQSSYSISILGVLALCFSEFAFDTPSPFPNPPNLQRGITDLGFSTEFAEIFIQSQNLLTLSTPTPTFTALLAQRFEAHLRVLNQVMLPVTGGLSTFTSLHRNMVSCAQELNTSISAYKGEFEVIRPGLESIFDAELHSVEETGPEEVDYSGRAILVCTCVGVKRTLGEGSWHVSLKARVKLRPEA